jgi:hypothetical protein
MIDHKIKPIEVNDIVHMSLIVATVFFLELSMRKNVLSLAKKIFCEYAPDANFLFAALHCTLIFF